MLKKCYIAIIGNDEGQPIGTVVSRAWFWYSAKWFFDKTDDTITGGHIIDFKRIK